MRLDELPPVRAFGTWDAPLTDEAEWIEVPTTLHCAYCHERFGPDANGAVMPTGLAQHRECSLRSVLGGIGHVVDHGRYCKTVGPDAGLPYRHSARLLWRHAVEGDPVDVAELEALRHLLVQP